MSRAFKILLIGICLLVPVLFYSLTKDTGIDSRRIRSSSSLRNLMSATGNYNEIRTKLPPPVTRSKDGAALYSWRVPLLPYLDSVDFYKRYKHDEPWDSRQNRELLQETPSPYRSPYNTANEVEQGRTYYLGFTGPGTAWEREGLTWKDFSDGLENTILITEAAEPVPWSKPEDLAYDPAKPMPRLFERSRRTKFFLGYRIGGDYGCSAVFADGSVRFINKNTDERVLRALITRNGGENIDWAEIE